ncbi:hypothetical protein GH733_009741 [Mirounga leonina]|nr:hypothetical protein GH733_009741 [Mirounga leonina]
MWLHHRDAKDLRLWHQKGLEQPLLSSSSLPQQEAQDMGLLLASCLEGLLTDTNRVPSEGPATVSCQRCSVSVVYILEDSVVDP